MTHTGAIRPYQATAYGRNTGVIQERGERLSNRRRGGFCSSGAAPGRWVQMVQELAGEPLPEPPALPGRVHRAPVPTERDPYPEQQQREVQAAAVWRELAGKP